MSKKYDSKVTILFIIFIVLVCIIFMCRLILNPGYKIREDFFSNYKKLVSDNSKMKQRHERARHEEILKSIDNSIDLGNEKSNRLLFENTDMNNELMTKYINDLMISDVGNPNKLLVEDSFNELPSVIENNLPQYNHEMRKLQNSKQIKQDYVIKILKYKIEKLLNSLKGIEELKDEIPYDKHDNRPLPIIKRDIEDKKRR